MGYIPQHSLENLKKYSYKGLDRSLLSRYVLNPFWNWFVTLWPTTVAPNTITLTGLSIVIFNFFTLLLYDPLYLTEKGGVDFPRWLFFTWAIGLFLYQSLDAIDGKQARRTGMSGPLGEMFDHGCDALNTTLECILACYALNMGRSWWTVASQTATLGNFYLTTWEEYHTGVLYLGPFSGPVEGIIMIVIIYVISGIYGPSFWDKGLLDFLHLQNSAPFKGFPNIPLNEAFMYFGAVGLGLNILNSYYNVLQAQKQSSSPPTKTPSGSHSSTETRASHSYSERTTDRPLSLLLPFAFSAAIQATWLSYPSIHKPAIIDSPVFVPFLCSWGLQFAHQVGRMILAHVTSGPFPSFDWVWIWSALGVLDMKLPDLLGRQPLIQSTPARTAAFVWLTLLVSAFAYARFCYLVIKDITNHLGIACFTVKKRDDKGVWRTVKEMDALANGKKLS